MIIVLLVCMRVNEKLFLHEKRKKHVVLSKEIALKLFRKSKFCIL